MEDYLKAIYRLHCQEPAGVIYINDIAADMGFHKSSVFRATVVLKAKGSLIKERYTGLLLTKEGLRQATFITQRYTILQRFLQEVLQIDPGTASQDACGMEHGISHRSYESLCRFLGD
jgi:DtxR family Mn-dependent transcriptional regulator